MIVNTSKTAVVRSQYRRLLQDCAVTADGWIIPQQTHFDFKHWLPLLPIPFDQLLISSELLKSHLWLYWISRFVPVNSSSILTDQFYTDRIWGPLVLSLWHLKVSIEYPLTLIRPCTGRCATMVLIGLRWITFPLLVSLLVYVISKAWSIHRKCVCVCKGLLH